MSKTDINEIIKKSAELANKVGIENISIKLIADSLNIKSLSLYNHIKNLEDIKQRLMIYGWEEMEEKIIQSVIGVSGYEALMCMCNAFYDYATQNSGVFNAMLWYNKYENKQMQRATDRLFSVLYKITSSLNISEINCNHLIRTLRSFLEGFSLLVNNRAFGNYISVKESFDLSLDIIIAGIKELEGK